MCWLLIFVKDLFVFGKKLLVLRDDQRFQCGQIQCLEIRKCCVHKGHHPHDSLEYTHYLFKMASNVREAQNA